MESAEGLGATFIILLPAAAAPVALPGKESDHPVIGTGRVLVMDDEEIIREIAKEIIEQIGYQAELANDGEEAIELYKKAMRSGIPFDVVIMDLTIPGGMGGEETVQHLFANDPHIRAIVSSGYSNDPIMANYREYGFVAVVSKPYTVGELSRKLDEVINRGESFAKPEA